MAKVVAKSQITLSMVADGWEIVLDIIGGVRGIAYAADGSTPEPNSTTKSPYTASFLKNGKVAKPYSYSWSCGGCLSGTSTTNTFEPKINNAYVSGNTFVTLSVKEGRDSDPFSQTIPITCTKHADGLDWINDWNSTATDIKNNRIVTPRLFAGTNTGTNLAPKLTGVTLGLSVLDGNKDITGIIGYKNNIPKFKLDINGNFFVGEGWGEIETKTGGGMKFDASTNSFDISGKVTIGNGSTMNNIPTEQVINTANSAADTAVEALTTVQSGKDRWDSNSNVIDSWTTPGQTTINGGKIETNSIKAEKLDVLGLTVFRKNGKPSFAITTEGDTIIDGLLKSDNFDDYAHTGYRINTDGTATFNQVKIRGDIELPNAGITNFGDKEEDSNHVRFWAGSRFEGRNSAKFRVYQNGDLYAFNGTFGGKVVGDFDSGKVHIHNDEIVINSTNTILDGRTGRITDIQPYDSRPNPHVRLGAKESLIDTNLILGGVGSKRFYFDKQNNRIEIRDSDLDVYGTVSSISIKQDSTGLNFKNLTTDALHTFQHSSSLGYENSLLMYARGSASSLGGDFRFAANKRDVEVRVQGDLSIDKSISTNSNKIKVKMESDGWGFYVV